MTWKRESKFFNEEDDLMNMGGFSVAEDWTPPQKFGPLTTERVPHWQCFITTIFGRVTLKILQGCLGAIGTKFERRKKQNLAITFQKGP